MIGASSKPDSISSASKRTFKGSALAASVLHSSAAINARFDPLPEMENGTPKQPAIATKLNRWAVSKSDAPQGISPKTCESLTLNSLT